MISLVTPGRAQQVLAANLRQRRLDRGLTQAGLAGRSGVSVATLRKFERTGQISLESFLKLSMVLGFLEALVGATAPTPVAFASIDEVLNAGTAPVRKRGRRA